jgi:hypothetical protein
MSYREYRRRLRRNSRFVWHRYSNSTNGTLSTRVNRSRNNQNSRSKVEERPFGAVGATEGKNSWCFEVSSYVLKHSI